MGLFDFLKKKETESLPLSDEPQSQETTNGETPIIDRNLFIKDQESPEITSFDGLTSWKKVFNTIRKDFETIGFNDALSTADNKYRNDNAGILQLDLQSLIEEAEYDINEYLTEIEFHISSRQKAQLIDLVEELESKKEVCLQRLKFLSNLKGELKNNTGTPQRIVLAYNRGFNRGLAALTMANVINKNF